MKLEHGISNSDLAMYELETGKQCLTHWEVGSIIMLSMIVGAILLMAGHFFFFRTLQWMEDRQEG